MEDIINEEIINKVTKTIFDRLVYGKTPSNNPIAIIVCGQPGAGKTGLIDKTISQYNNSVVLDVDDYRYFYPNIIDILKNNPDEFVSKTKNFVNAISQRLTKNLMSKKYNLILHKTLKDEEIIFDTINPLKENGYKVIIRAMIVCEIESKMSALERTLAFKKTVGWCRWVTKENHDYAYNNMPQVINKIFSQKFCNCVQIFKRCNIPNNCIMIYSIVQDEDQDFFVKNFKSSDLQFSNFNFFAYKSILNAIEYTREIDRIDALKDINRRLNCARKKISNKKDMVFVDEIKNLVKFYNKKYFLYHGKYMNNNTKLELAKEIMARIIALNCCDGFCVKNDALMQLIKEEEDMNNFDPKIIDKIIFTYGPMVKMGE